MLTISSKTRYGILATLSLAEHYGQGLVHIKDIANQNNIPLQYLAQILSQMVKADIITSVRGKNGGYRLSRAPSKITVLQILNVLEGGVDLVEKKNKREDAVHELFSKAKSILQDIFNITLDELLIQQQEKKDILFYDI